MTASTHVCADCGKDRRLEARGLCGTCYDRHRRLGTLADFPRLVRCNSDVIEDTTWLLDQGWSLGEIARRLGMQPASICRAYRRAGLPAPGSWVAS